MDHHLGIVAILTVGFALASFFAYLMQSIRLPSILGYLLAGYVIGPYSPGFVADVQISEQLAEIGVILMLFGVGLHFKLENLMNVKNIAIPGAIGQTLAATLVTIAFVHYVGWSIETGLILGLSIGVASTVVLLRQLTENQIVNTPQGHIAIGWLIVEDIFTVIILILLPTLAVLKSGASLSAWQIIGSVIWILSKFVALILLMFTFGHAIVSYVLVKIARLRSQELLTLTILALVFLIATGSSVVFGTSIALGAFISGMVIGKTTVKHQAAANALPLKDVFVVIFFLSVGMLFNPLAIPAQFPLFLGILLVIILVKPVIAYLITVGLGYSLKVGLTVAVALAQIGEFSFILAEEAMGLNLLPEDAFDVLIACATVSISLNPLLFQKLPWFEAMLQRVPVFRGGIKTGPQKTTHERKKRPPKTIVIGFGPIGKEVTKLLKELGYTPFIIEQNIDTVAKMQEEDFIIFGNASDANILKDAHIEDASYLLITIPDTAKTVEIIQAARLLNPTVQVVARTQYVTEKGLVDPLNIHYICAENEVLRSFTALIRHLFH